MISRRADAKNGKMSKTVDTDETVLDNHGDIMRRTTPDGLGVRERAALEGQNDMAGSEKSSSLFSQDRPRRPRPASQDAPLVHFRQPEDVWDNLRRFVPNAQVFEHQKMVSAARRDPAHVAFDVLRTRMTIALKERGWTRVGITSPTSRCGKSFVAGNLAISFSRQEELHTVLMDLDLNSPVQAQNFGLMNAGSMAEFLSGNRSVEAHFQRPGQNLANIGTNLALGLNENREMFGTELLQYPTAETAIDEAQALLDPDVMLFDLPPTLDSDAAVAVSQYLDCVLLVVAGDRTKSEQIKESERLLGEVVPILGVVMNKSQGVLFSR